MMHPHAYKVTYVDDVHHRTPTCGGMDSEYSHTTREVHTRFIVAPDFETAEFLFKRNHRANKTMEDVKIEHIGAVSILMTDNPCYGIY